MIQMVKKCQKSPQTWNLGTAELKLPVHDVFPIGHLARDPTLQQCTRSGRAVAWALYTASHGVTVAHWLRQTESESS